MRRLLTLVALTLSLPLAACSDDGAGPEDSVAGTYTLETVDGGALPWLAVQVEADKIEVISGSIVLGEDGSFTDKTTFRITEGGVARLEDDLYQGMWQKMMGGAQLTPTGLQPYVVQIEGDRLSQIIGQLELVYRR